MSSMSSSSLVSVHASDDQRVLTKMSTLSLSASDAAAALNGAGAVSPRNGGAAMVLQRAGSSSDSSSSTLMAGGGGGGGATAAGGGGPADAVTTPTSVLRVSLGAISDAPVTDPGGTSNKVASDWDDLMTH